MFLWPAYAAEEVLQEPILQYCIGGVAPPSSDPKKQNVLPVHIFNAERFVASGTDTDTDVDTNTSATALPGSPWREVTSFPGGPRASPIMVRIQQQLYMGLGVLPTRTISPGVKRYGGCTKDWYTYNATLQQWKSCSRFPGKMREQALCFLVDDKIYVGLGHAPGSAMQPYSSLYVYLPNEQRWLRRANIPTQTYCTVALTLQQQGYVGTRYGQWYRYTPTTNQWQKMESLPDEQYPIAAFVLQETAYVLTVSKTQADHHSQHQRLYAYQDNGQGWLRKADFPGGWRRAPLALATKTLGLVGYGYDAQGKLLHTSYAYDPDTDVWTAACLPPTQGPYSPIACVTVPRTVSPAI